MNLHDFRGEFTSAVTSLVVSLAATYGVAMVYPSADLQWALIAVGFASFFSGFFSHYYAE